VRPGRSADLTPRRGSTKVFDRMRRSASMSQSRPVDCRQRQRMATSPGLIPTAEVLSATSCACTACAKRTRWLRLGLPWKLTGGRPDALPSPSRRSCAARRQD
jgi:hypothetical protein